MTAADTEAPVPADSLRARLVADLDVGFADLVRAYDGAVYSLALRVCGQPHNAEDLTAEAFLRAYRALRGYSPDRILTLQPRAWLMTIVLNAWRNTVRDSPRRSRARRSGHEQSEAELCLVEGDEVAVALGPPA